MHGSSSGNPRQFSKFCTRLFVRRKRLFRQRLCVAVSILLERLSKPCRQNGQPTMGSPATVAVAKTLPPVSGRLAACARLLLSAPVTGKITLPQDICEPRGELSGAPPRREDQMQVRQQGWGI